MKREYHKWWSPKLGRDMELLIFGHSGAKVLVFPSRGGRFYEYEDLKIIESLREKVEAGWLQIFCVDGIDSESFYCSRASPVDRVKRYMEYEEYVLNEVLPLMSHLNSGPCTIAHGCSLGAFFAANIALKHPQLFQRLCAFSGRYNLTSSVEYFKDLLDGHYDESVYYNTPEHYLKDLGGVMLDDLREMDVVLACGREDPFLGSNHNLSEMLSNKGVNVKLYEWEGRAHQGFYWRQMASLYL